MRDDPDDRDARDNRRPPPRGVIHRLPPHRPEQECPWCRLLLPAEEPPEPPLDPVPHLAARLRTVMVAFSALVTLAAAVVTVWRT
ncbi:hypothetical protein ACF1BB_00410 [Streptomyces griseoluteus]|uniref:hypothetical protein n=1 Tax=Streptomyces griseoluteus TaxID=29306 RepID=UPI0036F4CE67